MSSTICTSTSARWTPSSTRKRFANSVVVSQIHQTAANAIVTSTMTSPSGWLLTASLNVMIAATKTRS